MQSFNTTAILYTKLHRPPLPVDLVPRPRLTDWLKKRQGRSLTLVSAPAGYGKSTLISCWIESQEIPSAWISLDEQDNDLGIFLNYFLAAIQSIFPNTMQETRAFVMATPLPPLSVIFKNLIFDLNQIEEPYLLVLDDYQRIKTQAIHDLISELLLHPLHNLHLVLGTRMDPPLPLVSLRAKSQMSEIRIQDLRFNFEETFQLLLGMVGDPVDRENVLEIAAQAEGWVTGLRLAALAMRHRIGRVTNYAELSVNNHYVTEYLLTEIMAKQPEGLLNCMLKTSILDRFCADLCEAVCNDKVETSRDESTQLEINGTRFLEWLEASNLFVIPLDNQREWFRYHHLFQDFLYQELTRRFSLVEIANLRSSAGHWLAQNGWVEEALYHLLPADDITAAIQLVNQHRYRMMNEAQWSRLEQLLNLFPPKIIEGSPELWMLNTWLEYHQGRFFELPDLLKHLLHLIAEEHDLESTKHLAGEISSLRAFLAYHKGDATEAIDQSRHALDILPSEFWAVRVLARMYLAGGLLLSGDEISGYHVLYDGFDEEKVKNKYFKATLLMTACNFHWVTADLQSMAQAANECISLCLEIDFREILGYGNYQLGRVRYQQDRLSEAQALFASIVARPYQNYGTSYIHSACGLAMTYHALGREAEAYEVVETAVSFLLETGNTTQMPVALALQAELAVTQGRLSAASRWAAKLNPVPPIVPMFGFLAPHLTLVKVWLAQNTPSSLKKAAVLLNKLQDYLEGIHDTRYLIETLALRALLEQALGNYPTAQSTLTDALELAQPGRLIRLFVDLGSQMANLLTKVRVDPSLQAYVEQIQLAFPKMEQVTPLLNLEKRPETLTNREIEVLELLAKRLTNKEIAERLIISPGTVKGYTINIYQKLNVSDRRQAVGKAIALGILASV